MIFVVIVPFDFFDHRSFDMILVLTIDFVVFDTPLPSGHKKIHIQLVFVISLQTEVDFVGNTTTVNCVKTK